MTIMPKYEASDDKTLIEALLKMCLEKGQRVKMSTVETLKNRPTITLEILDA